MKTRRSLYERHGVAEYLVIDSHERYAERYRPNPEGCYGLPDILGSRDVLELLRFPGFGKILGDLFGGSDDDLDPGRISLSNSDNPWS